MNLIKPINITIIAKRTVDTFAFVELRDSIYYGLKELGLEVRHSINEINSSALNIIINGHSIPFDENFLKSIPKDSIFINTEQLDSFIGKNKEIYCEEFQELYTRWHKMIVYLGQHFTIWDYSQRNIEHLKNIGVHNVKYLRLGFQKELKRIINKTQKDYDVLFYGTLNERRQKILDELRKRKVNAINIIAFGQSRDDFISRSKIVLNIHYFNAEIFENIRLNYLMNNAVAILSELNPTTSIDPIYKNAICGVEYDKLVETCIELLGNDDKLDLLRHNSLKTVLDIPQSQILKELLEI